MSTPTTRSTKPSAITVDSVYKDFKLPKEKSSSLKSTLVNMARRQKGYTLQHALRGVSFDIKEGEFFGILGRNGSGKSTLLKILAHIYQPTKGSVTTKGKMVPFIELGVGFNPDLTGRENVFLNGALLGFSRKEIEAKYDEIVAFAELEEFMDQKLKNYSSGMQVRLAFSVATQSQADILLVDEVLAVGDAEFQRKCYNYFKSLKKHNKTVVFVSHSMDAVREFCDRAVLIVDGKVAFEGTANKTANEYLKLFNDTPDQDNSQAEDQSRWGNQDVYVKTVKAKMSPKNVTVSIELDAKKDVGGPVVLGLRLNDMAGKVLAGTNTKQFEQKVLVKPGAPKTLNFTLPNVFGEASLAVGTTVRLDEDTTIFDNWDDIAIINNPNEKMPYPVIFKQADGSRLSVK
ncbi:ATP-binding cassette domain-containing protein [Candidatus Saccharibacteria bacterium]|nr:ATP-binding cassette domain-containing protein [Candidatus Saccharibacteria bacterium]